MIKLPSKPTPAAIAKLKNTLADAAYQARQLAESDPAFKPLLADTDRAYELAKAFARGERETCNIWHEGRMAGYIRPTGDGFDWFGLWFARPSQGAADTLKEAETALLKAFIETRDTRPNLLLGPMAENGRSDG